MKTSQLAAVMVAGLLPLVVACSGSADIADGDPTSTSTSKSPVVPITPSATVASRSPLSVTTPPRNAARLEGTGYSLEIPDGWEDITADLLAQNPRLDVALGETKFTGFRTNLNVVRTSGYTATIEENRPAIRREAAAELRSITKTMVRSLADRSVAGEAAIGQTSTFVSSGTSVTFQQYVVVHERAAYTVTMTFATQDRAPAESLLASILSSWQWA